MAFIIKVMSAHPDSVPVPTKTSQGIHQELLDLRCPDLDQHPTTWRTRVSGRVPAGFVVVELVTLFSKRLQIGVPGQVGGTAVHLVTGPTPYQCTIKLGHSLETVRNLEIWTTRLNMYVKLCVCNCNWVRFKRQWFLHDSLHMDFSHKI